MSTNDLISCSLEDYLSRLASAQPAPGGGSAAALTGALAASLGHMVCALTAGRPKFAAVETEIQELARRFERAREALAALVDEDARAYLQLHRAFSDKAHPQRREEIALAAEVAAAAPLSVAALAHGVEQDARRLDQIGNPNLKADIQAAIALAEAAIKAALANVAANLPLVRPETADALRQEVASLSR